MPHREDPFNIAIIGRFGGRASAAPILVDRDNFDDVLAAHGVRLEMPVAGEIAFRDIDDFHPDRLLERVGLFQQLRQARAGVASAVPVAAASSSPLSAAPRTSTLTHGLLDDALAATEGRAANAPPPKDALRAWIDQQVAPHVEQRESQSEIDQKALVEKVIAAQMRALLHVPDFQQLEAAWRGVEFVVRRIDSDLRVKVFIIDAADPETAEAVLRKRSQWALIAALDRFGLADLERLGRFCAIATSLGVPFIAEAAPELAGVDSAEDLPDPRTWRAPDPAWEEFRATEAARSGGLAFPRFLLRLPYGAKTNPCERLKFEEMPEEGGHERFLWGNPSLLCAVLLAESFEEDGWNLRAGKYLNVAGLPVYLSRRDGEVEAQPCAETVMTERAAQEILTRGIMAIATLKGSDEIRLVRFQSATRPPSQLPGPWTAA
jgi:type VI secretion system protein ImpC